MWGMAERLALSAAIILTITSLVLNRISGTNNQCSVCFAVFARGTLNTPLRPHRPGLKVLPPTGSVRPGRRCCLRRPSLGYRCQSAVSVKRCRYLPCVPAVSAGPECGGGRADSWLVTLVSTPRRHHAVSTTDHPRLGRPRFIIGPFVLFDIGLTLWSGLPGQRWSLPPSPPPAGRELCSVTKTDKCEILQAIVSRQCRARVRPNLCLINRLTQFLMGNKKASMRWFVTRVNHKLEAFIVLHKYCIL